MDVLIVFESMYGNTRDIAEAIAQGARSAGAEASVVGVEKAPPGVPDADLLVVGGPTHMHGMSTQMTRRFAIKAAQDAQRELDPSAAGPLLRTWLRHLAKAPAGAQAAAFDTRADASAAMTGSAARGISRRLAHHGYAVAGRASFLVDEAEGPLAAGELERARDWGRTLAVSQFVPVHA
jgi:hypothetical protein